MRFGRELEEKMIKRILLGSCLLFLGCRGALSIAAGVSVRGQGSHGQHAEHERQANDGRHQPPRR